MDKTINISTLKDILDKVPIECVDSFLIDLKGWIELCHKGRILQKQFPWMIEYDDTTIPRLNDWGNKVHIQIKIKDNPDLSKENE